ncbi:hypothetical protein B0H14DRAFT_2654773, partial [Mycena olivaceomarginata]
MSPGTEGLAILLGMLMLPAFLRTSVKRSAVAVAILNATVSTTCEFFDEEILDGLERYETDEQGMQELWDRALDQNEEEEAASAPGIICRCPPPTESIFSRMLRLEE